MDPNTTLQEIRELCDNCDKMDALFENNHSFIPTDDDEIAHIGMQLHEKVRCLDEWMTNGSFPPYAWTRP